MASTNYSLLYEQAQSLLENESDFIANCANLSALLFSELADVNWLGFYLLDSNRQELVLGPFQGPVACTRIAIGKGVCGTSAVKGEPVIVDDVDQFDGHIACDASTRSELVIPLIQTSASSSRLRGVLAVDSQVLGRFTPADVEGLQRISQLLINKERYIK